MDRIFEVENCSGCLLVDHDYELNRSLLSAERVESWTSSLLVRSCDTDAASDPATSVEFVAGYTGLAVPVELADLDGFLGPIQRLPMAVATDEGLRQLVFLHPLQLFGAVSDVSDETLVELDTVLHFTGAERLTPGLFRTGEDGAVGLFLLTRSGHRSILELVDRMCLTGIRFTEIWRDGRPFYGE
jgi:hypothetical protein